MSDEKIIETMIKDVEELIREKVREDFEASNGKNRKAIAKEIIKMLEGVMKDENQAH